MHRGRVDVAGIRDPCHSWTLGTGAVHPCLNPSSMAHRRDRVRTQVNLHDLVAAVEGRKALVEGRSALVGDVDGRGPVVQLGGSDAREGGAGLRAWRGVAQMFE